MLDLNDWVLERGADAVRQWRAAGWKDARVAINVSAQQFVAGDFLGAIERLLRRHDLPPECLELELTENMLQTGAITVETLHGLQLLGVATALDDFGTGYSSLTSLEQLPLSRVKLDRSVVAEVDWNPRAASIARSIIALCRGLGLQVTVEGVERPSQLDFLVGCGDVSVQGYLIAHPADRRRRHRLREPHEPAHADAARRRAAEPGRAAQRNGRWRGADVAAAHAADGRSLHGVRPRSAARSSARTHRRCRRRGPARDRRRWSARRDAC